MGASWKKSENYLVHGGHAAVEEHHRLVKLRERVARRGLWRVDDGTHILSDPLCILLRTKGRSCSRAEVLAVSAYDLAADRKLVGVFRCVA